MNARFIMTLIGILVLVGGGFFLAQSGESPTGDVVVGSTASGNVQEITLSLKNGNYAPNTFEVEAGKPVRVYLDSSVVGCYRSFTIAKLGVRKTLRTPQDYVEFTPAQKGTFGFACSMGMGTGTMIVK